MRTNSSTPSSVFLIVDLRGLRSEVWTVAGVFQYFPLQFRYYIERETRGEYLLQVQQFRNPSRRYLKIWKVLVDDRLYTTNTNAEFSQNVWNFHPMILQNE